MIMAIPKLYMIMEKYQQPGGLQHARINKLLSVDIMSHMNGSLS
jgi:hypothetical protein